MKANAPCSGVRRKIAHAPHTWKGLRADWKCPGFEKETVMTTVDNTTLIARLEQLGFKFERERSRGMTWQTGPFGLTVEVKVREFRGYHGAETAHTEPTYHVYLPHSCDEWEIAPRSLTPSSAGKDVLDLVEDLRAAEQMLAMIEDGPSPSTFPAGTRIIEGGTLGTLGTIVEWQGEAVVVVDFDNGTRSIGRVRPDMKMVECGPDPASWFGRGVWPKCQCGLEPRNNKALSEHWAERGFRVIDEHGTLVKYPVVSL